MKSGRATGALASAALCVGVLASVLVQGEVTRQTAAAVDANWRGVYDILVTPMGQDFGGSSTAGLVDGNFVATGGTAGITDQTLADIRKLPDVEVAAPIGMVGVLRQLNLGPQVFIVDDLATGHSVLSANPTVYRLTAEMTRHTDLGSAVVSRAQGIVALRSQRPGEIVNPDPQDPVMGASVGGFGPQISEIGFQVPLGALPAFGTGVIAVDPVAEQELLRGRGQFLRPLSLKRGRTAGEYGANGVPPGSEFATQHSAIVAAQADPSKARTPLVPLVVNTSANGQSELRLTVEKATSAPDRIPHNQSAWDELVPQLKFAPFTTLTRDISNVTVPFSSPDLSLLWPDSEIPEGNDPGLFSSVSTSLLPALIGRPSYQAADGTGNKLPQFSVLPQQIVGADGLAAGSLDPQSGSDPTVGLVRAYRSLTDASGTGFSVALPEPLGTFTADDLVMPFNATSYVPLGAYDANTTTEVATAADASAGGQAGRTVLPSLSGLDFITSPPGAFTDLAGGTALRGDTPIDAIRVRIGGITGYTPDAVAKVNATAQAIAALGVKATVVAGSSPQPVAVYVPEYYPGKSGSAADLGWVRQDWTTLGAATTVLTARSALTTWLLALGVGVAALALICASILSGRLRRVEVGVLRDVGWTERHIRLRLTRSQIVPVLAVVVVATVSAVLARDHRLAGWAAGGGALAAVLGGASAVWMAGTASATRNQPSTGRHLVTSARSLLWRQARLAPWTTGIKILEPAITGIAGTAIVTAIVSARQDAGHTRLADVVDSTTFVGTLLLGAVGMIAAMVITAVGVRSDQRHRGWQWNTLRAIGFQESQIRRIQRTDILGTAIVAAVITAGCGAAAATAGGVTGASAAIGVGVAVLTSATSGLLSTRTASTNALPTRAAPAEALPTREATG